MSISFLPATTDVFDDLAFPSSMHFLIKAVVDEEEEENIVVVAPPNSNIMQTEEHHYENIKEGRVCHNTRL